MGSTCDFELDLRGVVCPLNFVRTKLFLDKMTAGQTVSILLDGGEAVESVSASITAEGHEITGCCPEESGHYCVSIRKVLEAT